MDKFIGCYIEKSLHKEFKSKVASKGLKQREVVSILIQKYVRDD